MHISIVRDHLSPWQFNAFTGCGSGCAGNESCDGQVIKDGIISVCEPAWWHVNDDEVYGPVSRDMAHAHAMGMSSPILSGGKPVIGNQVHAPYILLYIRLADPDIGLEPSTLIYLPVFVLH